MYSNYLSYIKVAFRDHWAVGAFNISNLEQAQGVIQAAEKLQAPVLVNTSEKAIDYAGLLPLALIVKILAQETKVRVTLNLDHGRSFKVAAACVRAGYNSLMIDGSALPYNQNVAVTAKVANLAHRRGIPVEGELGALGGKEDYISGKVQMTDPAQAKDFIKRTKVNLLAIAIGNAHGIPQANEKLDFERLKAIHQTIPNQPLVLHGASSTPANNLRRAISLGVVKINIDTDLRLAFATSLRKFLKHNQKVWDPREILGPTREAIQKVVENKIKIFGSNNKSR
ncbi:MAG: class II fructose-bisphosphate aldolase [Patescibacteria group bacterium]|jgi:fructose-bisphosphate aldolase class II